MRRLDEPRGRYMLTMRLVAVAGQWLEHAELLRLARPLLEASHADSGLTAHLVTPAYDRVVCVAHCGASDAPRPHVRELVPAHCTAGGKALLSERHRWRERLLRGALLAYTERTITDPAELEREATRTRERGYAARRR